MLGGANVPTILLVRDPEELEFDLRGQHCLVYKKIKDLEEVLRTELENLKEQREITVRSTDHAPRPKSNLR